MGRSTEEHAPVKQDNVSDVLIIGPLSLGVAACILYCSAGAVGAAAWWVFRQSAPKPTGKPEWTLAG